ncbi:adenylate/guanylate cyclase domain-containing protein [Microvirga arabica]|nr:adenylate/guanylate cyclase domain-containing protein [Microvirga arabica]
MGINETRTLRDLIEIRRTIFSPIVADNRGRVVKLMGDGALVEFASVVDAVNAAVEIQRALTARNAGSPLERRIELRVGVNLGDVIIEGSDIYGDGVNLAARLQEVAGPGEVVLSATAHEHAASRVDVQFTDAGEQSLKNIATPVRVFRWSAAGGEARATATTGKETHEVPERPSIAVLPFDNMSGDPEQEYLADGVVEAITAALSRIRSFFVIARNSAFAYKGRHKNVREIGRELGVSYVLEGSVQRAGGRVRITVQLIETAGGAHIWAEKYDGALDDIFELQDRITEQVAGALQPSIRLAEVERVRRKRPQDLGAYGYTMQAMPHVWALEKQEAERALALLNKALEIDPDYPLALALAAWCWAQRSVYSWVANVSDAKVRALSLGERAATLSNDEPLILAILGAVHTFARNFGTARVLLERAIALDPNAAWALSRLGWLEVYSGRPEAAHAYFERALRLSPLDPMNFNNHVGIASAFQVAGRPAKAADEFLRALHERPNALWIHRNLAPALLAAGREEEAKASRDALARAYPEFTIARFKEAMVFDPDTLERIADDLRKLGVPEA